MFYFLVCCTIPWPSRVYARGDNLYMICTFHESGVYNWGCVQPSLIIDSTGCICYRKTS